MARIFSEIWVPYLNVVPVEDTATHAWQSMVLNFKRALCGQTPNNLVGAWKVIFSSNAVDANAADNWQTLDDIVGDAEASPHSYIVLRSPTGYLPDGNFVEIMINCLYNTNDQVEILFANSNNPFVVTAATISTSPPTPANAYSFPQQLRAAGTTAHKMHFWRTQSGIFIAGFTEIGTGFVQHMLASFTGVRAGDRDVNDSFNAAVYGATNLIAGTFTRTTLNSNCMGFWTDATQHNFALCTPYPSFTDPASSYVFHANSGQSAVSNNWVGFPMDLYAIANGGGAQATLQAYRGRVPDMQLGSAIQTSNNFADTDTSAPLRLLSVQDFWLPVENNETVDL